MVMWPPIQDVSNHFIEQTRTNMSQAGQLRRLVFDQSSPVHPVSESRGGYPERDGAVGVVGVAGRYFSFLI